jgi:hypothetical protein
MTYDLRSISSLSYRFAHRIGGLCCAFFVSLTAHAGTIHKGQTVQPGVIQFSNTTSGVLVPSKASDGSLTLTVGPLGAAGSSVNVTQPTIGMQGSSLAVQSPVRVSPHSGTVIDVQAREVVPNRTAGRLIGKALKIIPVVNTGVALYDFIKELGGDVVADSDGKPISIRTVEQGTGQWYSATSCPATPQATAQVFASFSDVCTLSQIPAAGLPGTLQVCSPSNPCSGYQGTRCRTSYGGYIYGFCSGPYQKNIDTPVTGDVETVVGDFVNSKTLSNTSKAPDAVAQALSTLPNDSVPSSSTPTVFGPSKTLLPTTTTTQPDGTKKEEKREVQHAYSGDKMTSTVVTTTNIYNTSNQITSVTTSTEEATPEKTGCEADTTTLDCISLGTPPTDEIPKVEKNITFSPEFIAGSASCPANRTAVIGGKTVTVWAWDSYCPLILSYAKPVILVVSAFASLMIVLGGKLEI